MERKELVNFKILTCNDFPERENIYHFNKLLDFNELHKYFCVIRMYKYFKLGLNSYFFQTFTNCVATHTIPTRFRLNRNLNIPHLRLSKCKNSFISQSIKFWNELPLLIKEIPSLKKFKTTLRSYYMQS